MYVAQCAISCVLSASEKEICSETNQKREIAAETQGLVRTAQKCRVHRFVQFLPKFGPRA